MKRGKGRPTEYKPEFCQMLIDWMAEGKTIKDFAKHLKVTKETVSRWGRIHPEFLEAKDMGHYKSRTRER